MTLISLSIAQNCHITGRVAVPELQGKNIAVLNMNTGKTLASTRIVDSVFALDIEVTEPFVGMLKTDPQNNNPRSFYYLRMAGEPGDIYADLVTDSLSGTPMNAQIHQYTKRIHREVSVINAYNTQLRESVNMPAEMRQELESKVDHCYDELRLYLWDAFMTNKDNALGAIALEDCMDLTDASAYEYVMSELESAAPVVTSYQPLVQKLAKMEILSHTAAGKPFIDLDLTDYKTGRPIKLSKVIKDKVALIDFWASWCGPCRREIPNIKKIHEQYGGKDFVVVSLNVWDKPEGQAKAIKDLNMTWTQLTDPTHNATNVYGVDGIPQILLIGKDGVIIARDLRGDDIEKTVKKALGK